MAEMQPQDYMVLRGVMGASNEMAEATAVYEYYEDARVSAPIMGMPI
jgi:hypothetical protein